MRRVDECCSASLVPLARGDSATTVPAKRRAMSDAASMHAHLDGPLSMVLKPSAFSHSEVGAMSCFDSPRSDGHAPLGGATPGRSLTSPPQPVSGRLKFAHAVTPHISNIGRQLALQYAVNFESCRLRAPSQELPSQRSECPGDHRQTTDEC